MTWREAFMRYNRELKPTSADAHAQGLVNWLSQHCRYCGDARDNHVRGKCLFDASTFHSLASKRAVWEWEHRYSYGHWNLPGNTEIPC